MQSAKHGCKCKIIAIIRLLESFEHKTMGWEYVVLVICHKNFTIVKILWQITNGYVNVLLVHSYT